MTLQPPRNNDGYFNSGASSHMASDAGILSTSSQSPVHSSIVVGNVSLLPVTSTGSASLPRNFHLNNVLVAPKLIKNLISVRHFITDNNCSIEFDPTGCSVKALPSRNMIVRCNSSRPLYPLCLPTATSFVATVSQTLWHRRLEHPGHEALSKLGP